MELFSIRIQRTFQLVSTQRKNFKPDDFAIKVETLRNKVLHKYDIQTECLTLEDM